MPKRFGSRVKKNRDNVYQQDIEDGGVRNEVSYTSIVRTNEQLFSFYRGCGVIPDGCMELHFDTLTKDLPTAFRITGSGNNSEIVLDLIKKKYCDKIGKAIENSHLNTTEEDDEASIPLRPLPWYVYYACFDCNMQGRTEVLLLCRYPSEHGWHFNFSRRLLKRTDVLKDFRDFLINENNSGCISRQEAVSMIPPLLLDVQSHHHVLDMCAAPGSKTAQLIEHLHSEAGGEVLSPPGLVVANDVNNKRCYLMIHQVKRLESPNCVVTNHDAAIYPSIITSNGTGKLLFDRVLVDAPCSGDGTLRKNIDLWRTWTPASGSNLHCIQLRILRRGIELLKPGGRIVYSTCSLNPIEDEAVIATTLLNFKNELELVDVSNELPALKRLAGVSTWKILSKAGDWYSTVDEVPENLRSQMRPTMFPPRKEIAETLHLDRCMRILPHLQDTGGFFVAVIHKRSDGIQTEVSDSQPKSSKRSRQGRYQGYKENPFVYLKSDDPVWPSIRDFYGTETVTGEFEPGILLSRCDENQRKRNIYLTSKSAKDFIEANPEVKLVHAGLKIFVRSPFKDVPCDFRLCQEGISTAGPYLKGRRVDITREDLIVILTNEMPYKFRLTEKVRLKVESLSVGSVIFVWCPDKDKECNESSDGVVVFPKGFEITICGWNGRASVRSFVPPSERAHYLEVLGVKEKFVKKGEEVKKQKIDEGSEVTELVEENMETE